MDLVILKLWGPDYGPWGRVLEAEMSPERVIAGHRVKREGVQRTEEE